MQLSKKFLSAVFKKFCLWLSKKYLESKSNFHSLVMNSPFSIKCSCEKIFVANFAFFNNYNIFFIKLQVKKPSTWIGSDMPGPRRAAHVSEEKLFLFREERGKNKGPLLWAKKTHMGMSAKSRARTCETVLNSPPTHYTTF